MSRKEEGKTFRFKLIEFRTGLGISQIEFAKILGINRSTYQNYESGRLTIPLKLMGLLVKIYNINLNEWVLGEIQNV